MELNQNASLSALSYQFPFLNPGCYNAFPTSNLQIALPIQILNLTLCDQINTVLLGCDEIIKYESVIAYGYVNIDATDYTIYVGDRGDIYTDTVNDFVLYKTDFNNTSLNSKIHMGLVSFEFLGMAPNIEGPSHIKFTLWRGTICPALNYKINVIKLKRHKTLVMKLSSDVLQDCNSCNVPETTGCKTKLVFDYCNPSTAEITYAKNFLMNYLQEFPWQAFNVNQYNAFNIQYTPIRTG